MKKIITLILALAFGVCAYAKTTDELVSEFNVLNNWSERVAFVNDNLADVQTAWADFKGSQLSTFEYSAEYDKLTKTQKAELQEKRMLFRYLYVVKKETIDATDAQKLALSCQIFARNNPQKYDEIKKANWVFNGKSLLPYVAIYMAGELHDGEALYTLKSSFKDLGKSTLDSLVKSVMQALLSWDDAEKAKEVCNAYETEMILKGCANVDKIQLASKALTARIVDRKITR